MNTWKDYQKLAITTAIYPKKAKILYPVLGLVDESVEFYEKIGEKGQIKEIGDCFLCLVLLAHDLELDIESIFEIANESEAFEFLDIYDAGLDLIKCAAKICGVTKKWIRDEKGKIFSDDKLNEIEYELAEYMAACIFICGVIKVHWQDVADINRERK